MLMLHIDKKLLGKMKFLLSMAISKNILSEFLENVFLLQIMKKVNIVKDNMIFKIYLLTVKLI